MKGKLHFKRLDSLRFIAFFLVIWQHAFSNSFSEISKNETIQIVINALTNTGGIGVHIFFVISGFLITFIMLNEEKNNGHFNILYFYIRRILRIWPLYYLVMGLGIFILPFIFNTFKFDANIFKNLFFLNNYGFSGIQISNIGIAWSVAIEEQFYIFWPILFLFLNNKRTLSFFTLMVFIGSTIFIILYPINSYFHTFGNLNYLMAGCFGALFYFKNDEVFRKSKWMKTNNIFFVSLLAILMISLTPFSQLIYYFSLIGLPFIYLYLVILLVLQSENQKPSLISNLGKYTYGMYLYHPIIIIFVKIIFDLMGIDYQRNIITNLILAIVSLIVTIFISFVSYEYFEKHILKFKDRFSFVKTRI